MILVAYTRTCSRLLLPNLVKINKASFPILRRKQIIPAAFPYTARLNFMNHSLPTDDIPWDELYQHDKVLPLTNKEQRKVKRRKPAQPENPRLLRVAIIGSPNAGKSTLANRLIGWRFSAVSNKVHTTRHSALGVMTQDESQIVFLDTPGLITPSKMKKHNLERSLLVDPHSALYQADLVMVIVDVSVVWHRSRMDPLVLMALNMHPAKHSILVLNKVDRLKNKETLLHVTRSLTGGIVDGRQDWVLPSAKDHTVDTQALFGAMEQETEQSATDHTNEQTNSLSRNIGNDRNIGNSRTDTEIIEGYSVTASSGSDQVVLCKMSEGKSTEIELQDLVPPQADTGDKDDQSEIVDDKKGENLQQLEVWKAYQKKLRGVEKRIRNQISWQHFDRVFMISALSGEGVLDLKRYLLDVAPPGRWLYHSSMVTDQDPIEMARMCVKEKLLNYLPAEIPYHLHVTLSFWEVDQDGMLRAVFDIDCPKKRHLLFALGKNGATIRRVAAEAKQELMNTFRRDLTLKLLVRMAKTKR